MKRERWIDFIKGCCIIAVVLNHLYGVFYTNQRLLYSTAFAVMLLVFMSGLNSGNSMKKWKWEEPKYIINKSIRKIWKIWAPYLVSVALFCVIIYHKLDIPVYVNYLFNFSVWGSYYICFFTQLIIVAPVIFIAYKCCRNKVGYLLSVLATIAFLSIMSVRYSTMGNFLFGARYILGGVYLFIFSMGILCALYFDRIVRYKIILGGIALFYISYIQISGTYIELWAKSFDIWVILYSISVFIVLYLAACCDFGKKNPGKNRGGVFLVC